MKIFTSYFTHRFSSDFTAAAYKKHYRKALFQLRRADADSVKGTSMTAQKSDRISAAAKQDCSCGYANSL